MAVTGRNATGAVVNFETKPVGPASEEVAGTRLLHDSGTPVTSTNPLPVEQTYVTAVEGDYRTLAISASGDNIVHDPAAGKKVRLSYVALNADGANTADVLCIAKFGAAGAGKARVSLKAGSIYAHHFAAGNRYIEGAADANLIVNLSAAQTVHVTYCVEEV